MITIQKLNLDSLPADVLPKLEAVVRNAKHEIICHVEASLVALIVSPENKLLYLEAVCSSDAGAHALMGCVSDPRGAVTFRYYNSGGEDGIELFPPDAPVTVNARLTVPGWSRHVHHVAILDRSGDLVLAGTDTGLWRKLREKMTCPTLDGWSKHLMPIIHESGLLLACESFGIPDGFRAFVLAADAQKSFDGIVSNHVRSMCSLRAAS